MKRFLHGAPRALTIAAPLAVMAGTAFAQAQSIVAEDAQGYEQRYVTTDVNLRAGPGTDYRVLAVLEQGDFVNVASCEGNWCAVNAGAVPDGYVYASYIAYGENPYHDLGPAGPGIPDQEPGTRQSNGQSYGDDMLPAPGNGGAAQGYGDDMLGSAETRAFERVQERLGYRDARIAWGDDNCALYRAITPDNQLYEEPLRTEDGRPICSG